MSLFDNENVKKGWTKKKRLFLIAIAVLMISIFSCIWGTSIADKKSKKIVELEEVISKKASKKEDKKVKVKIYYQPWLLAEKDDTSSAYYIVSSKDYFYIAKMEKSLAEKITKKDVENGYELVGFTDNVPSEVKKFAIDEYNEAYGDELERKVTLADYDDIFGDVCIDLGKDDFAVFAPVQYAIFGIGLIIGFVLLISSISLIIVYRIKVGKLNKSNKEDLDKLGEEVNNGNAIFYDKGQIYLTNNYLLDVSNLQYFKYEDIFWVYKHIQRVNGIVSYTCLMLTKNDGKQYVVAMNAKNNYEEIMNELAIRNSNIRIGYTAENQDALKMKKKELKEAKKNKKA